MFRKMRRFKQQIPTEECIEILRRAKTGVLALHGDDGYPYAVPLNFAYEEGGSGLGTIGFHCAKTGHKLDAIRRDEKVCFTVVDRDEVLPRERTTRFCSVIVFGRARILEDEEALRRAAMAIGNKYCKGYEQDCLEETEDTIRRGTLCCVEITIDHMTGKIGRELLMERQNGVKAPGVE